MLHHISLPVSDIKVSANFYDSALKPLGYKRVFSSENFVGYGTEEGKDKFAIVARKGEIRVPSLGFHLAFSAPSRTCVDTFHSKAIKAGGTCNGSPGLRTNYGPHYYAAFVKDPDGYHLEAVNNTLISLLKEP